MKYSISLAPKVSSMTAQTGRLNTEHLTKISNSIATYLYGAIDELNATGAYTENARSSVIDSMTSDLRYLQKAVNTFCRRQCSREHSNLHTAIRVMADRVSQELAFTRSVSAPNSNLTRLSTLLELVFKQMPQSYKGRDMFAAIRDSDGRPHRPNSLLRTSKHRAAERMFIETQD